MKTQIVSKHLNFVSTQTEINNLTLRTEPLVIAHQSNTGFISFYLINDNQLQLSWQFHDDQQQQYEVLKFQLGREYLFAISMIGCEVVVHRINYLTKEHKKYQIQIQNGYIWSKSLFGDHIWIRNKDFQEYTFIDLKEYSPFDNGQQESRLKKYYFASQIDLEPQVYYKNIYGVYYIKCLKNYFLSQLNNFTQVKYHIHSQNTTLFVSSKSLWDFEYATQHLLIMIFDLSLYVVNYCSRSKILRKFTPKSNILQLTLFCDKKFVKLDCFDNQLYYRLNDGQVLEESTNKLSKYCDGFIVDYTTNDIHVYSLE